MKDYYKILQVKRNASQIEIIEAYEKHLIKCFPSNHFIDFDHDSNYFQDIEESYTVLSDHKKRHAYDRQLKEPASGEKAEEKYDFDKILQILLTSGKVSAGGKKIKSKFAFHALLLIFLCSVAFAMIYYYKYDKKEGFDKVALEIPKLNAVTESKNTTKQLSESTGIPVLESNIRATETVVPDILSEATLKNYFSQVSDQNKTWEEKEEIIVKTLNLFESDNSHIIVLGLNDTPVRRQTVRDYLDFILIQGHQIAIKAIAKNEKGEITQLELLEHYNDEL